MIIRKKRQLLEWKRTISDNTKIVVTNGCFDLLHTAHRKHLHNVKTMISHETKLDPANFRLVVGVNSDQSVLSYKKQLPVTEEMDRLFAVDDLDCVDITYLMQETNPSDLLWAVKPQFYVKGHDWLNRIEEAPEYDTLKTLGIKVLIDTSTKYLVTSSDIKKRIKEG